MTSTVAAAVNGAASPGTSSGTSARRPAPGGLTRRPSSRPGAAMSATPPTSGRHCRSTTTSSSSPTSATCSPTAFRRTATRASRGAMC